MTCAQLRAVGVFKIKTRVAVDEVNFRELIAKRAHETHQAGPTVLIPPAEFPQILSLFQKPAEPNHLRFDDYDAAHSRHEHTPPLRRANHKGAIETAGQNRKSRAGRR